MHTTNHSPTPVAHAPVAFDEDGFLADPTLWSRELAVQVAELDGLAPLTDTHWKVIDHVRERYARVGGVPAMRQVCRATSVARSDIAGLFGSCRAIWRLAGLPNPGEEAKSYF